MGAVNDAIKDVQLFTSVTIEEFHRMSVDSSNLKTQCEKAMQALKRKEIENLQDRRTLERLTNSLQQNMDILTESVKRKPSVQFMEGKSSN